MTDTTIGQIIILLTTVGGFAVSAWRENRNRHWATEDRQVAAQLAAAERRAATEEIVARATAEAQATRIHNEAVAETLRLEGIRTAAELREEARIVADNLRIETAEAVETTRKNTQRESAVIQAKQDQNQTLMAAKVDEAKDAAHHAYQEANHLNVKIEATASAVSDLNKRLLQQGTESQAAGLATTKQLTRIEAATTDIVVGAPPYIERLDKIKESVDGLTERDVQSLKTEGSDTNVRVRDIQQHVDHDKARAAAERTERTDTNTRIRDIQQHDQADRHSDRQADRQANRAAKILDRKTKP